MGTFISARAVHEVITRKICSGPSIRTNPALGAPPMGSVHFGGYRHTRKPFVSRTRTAAFVCPLMPALLGGHFSLFAAAILTRWQRAARGIEILLNESRCRDHACGMRQTAFLRAMTPSVET